MLKFDKHLLDRSKPVYIGFSAGYDSLAAAHFLSRGGWDVQLLHIKHFTNSNSARIALGAIAAAESLGLPIKVLTPSDHSASLANAVEHQSMHNEAGAFLVRDTIIRSLDHNVVLVNTLNDLAETYLQNCIKGIPMRVPLYAVNGNKIRPFLRTKRYGTVSYVQNHNIGHLVVPDNMPNQRSLFRSSVFPTLGNDLTSTVRRMFVDTELIYSRISSEFIAP